MLNRWIMLVVVLCLALGSWAQTASDYNNQGIKAYEAGRFDIALQHFQKAYELTPENKVIRRNMCNALQAKADALAKGASFGEATELLRTAISVDPENPSPLIQLGSYYLRQDIVSDAVFCLEEAVELAPGNLDAHELLGRAYYDDNDHKHAMEQLSYVLKMDPDRKGVQELYEKAQREAKVEKNFKKKNGRYFKMTFPPKVPLATQSSIERILNKAYYAIGQKFGGVYPPEPVQVVFYGGDEFQKATRLGKHVGAVFDGKIRCPLTDEDGDWLTETQLRERLTHEYVHVIVRNIAGDNAPWWLNEGLAEVMSVSLDERTEEMLERMYSEGLDFDLRKLEGEQLTKLSPESLKLAYLQSHATVNYLHSKWGNQRITRLLQSLGEGTSMEKALGAIYRKDYDGLIRDIALLYN